MLRLLRIIFAALAFAFTLPAPADNFLKDFLDKLAVSSVAIPMSDPAMQAEAFKIAARIPTAPADLLAASLPSASRVLTKGGAGQRFVVILLLFDVSRRKDGLVLLKPYLPDILACLRDPSKGMAGIANYILLGLFPQPVETVVPYLIDYINDDQVDEELRGAGIGTLVWYAPNEPAAISAITGFMKAKHGRKARAGAVQSIGLSLANYQRYSPELVQLIIDTIRNDPDIRLESIQALGRCGWKAFPAANPVLAEIAGDERESTEIRDAAKEAIDGILHSPRN